MQEAKKGITYGNILTSILDFNADATLSQTVEPKRERHSVENKAILLLTVPI